MQRPKLKDSKNKTYELYPLGQIPDNVVRNIGKWIVYYFAVGKTDINGEDWGDIFGKSIDGGHSNSPAGLADVIYEGMAWSVKSVKNNKPHTCNNIRVISGRCSPDYSYGITDPHSDIQKTGTAVLGIWNERVNIAKDNYEPLRSVILIRNPDLLRFSLYESEIHRFNTSEYIWQENQHGNLEGREKATGRHIFTWQPHGSQFTIKYQINERINFIVKKPPMLEFNQIMSQIGYKDDWTTIL